MYPEASMLNVRSNRAWIAKFWKLCKYVSMLYVGIPPGKLHRMFSNNYLCHRYEKFIFICFRWNEAKEQKVALIMAQISRTNSLINGYVYCFLCQIYFLYMKNHKQVEKDYFLSSRHFQRQVIVSSKFYIFGFSALQTIHKYAFSGA